MPSSSSASSNSSSSSSESLQLSESSLSSDRYSQSSASSSSDSDSAGPDEIRSLLRNPQQNDYPSVLFNDDDPGTVKKIDAMMYSVLAVAKAQGPVFIDLQSFYANSEIRYTINGRNPTSKSKLYKGPLKFRRNVSSDNTVLKARVFQKNNSNIRGKIIRFEFKVLP